jgi:hypothetical protein
MTLFHDALLDVFSVLERSPVTRWALRSSVRRAAEAEDERHRLWSKLVPI